MRLSELSIRNKFALPVAGMLLLLGALVVIAFPARLKQVTEDDLLSKGTSIAKIIGHSSSAALEFGDEASVRQFLESAQLDEDVVELDIFDREGKRFVSLSSDGSSPDEVVPTSEFVSKAEDGRIDITGPIIKGERLVGHVHVGISTDRVQARNQSDFWKALFVTLVAGIGGFVWVFIVARRLTAPIEELTATAESIANEDMTALAGETKRMASGDLTGHVLIPSRHIDLGIGGEIGRMSRAFNLMLAKLAEVAEATNLVSAGLRTIVIHVQSSAEEVASGSDSIAKATGDAARRNESTVGAVEEISATLHEMNVNIQNVARNAQSQSASTTHTLGSVEDLLRSVETVAATARDLMELTQRAGVAVSEGDAAMEHASNGMTEIRNVIGASAEHVQVLGNMAGDIGSIVAVIDEIADQSNLLALNAAIEAARAGEHGVGFAVVAEEVRKLAERSTRSTGEIAELVKRIQAQVGDAVDNMGKSTAIVEAGMGRTEELRVNLGRIEEVVTEVARCSEDIGSATQAQSKGTQQIEQATSQLRTLTREISAATEEQSTGAQQVVRAIKDFGDMVQANSDNASDLAASSHELLRQVSLMREVAGRFQVDAHLRGLPTVDNEAPGLGAAPEHRQPSGEWVTKEHPEPAEPAMSGAIDPSKG